MRKERKREWRGGEKENKGEQTRRRGKEEAARSERRAHAAVRPGSAASVSNGCPKELLHKKTQRTAQSHEECMKKKTKKKEEGSYNAGRSASQTYLQHHLWAALRRRWRRLNIRTAEKQSTLLREGLRGGEGSAEETSRCCRFDLM